MIYNQRILVLGFLSLALLLPACAETAEEASRRSAASDDADATSTGDGNEDDEKRREEQKDTPPAAPTCTATVSPATVSPGGLATIGLDIVGQIDSLLVDGNPADISTRSQLIAPAASKTYEYTVANEGGSSTCTVSINVTSPTNVGPSCTLTLDYPVIKEGGSIIVTFTTTLGQTTSATLNGQALQLPVDYKRVTPTVTTTYTAKVYNSKGQGNECSVTATVIPRNALPECVMPEVAATIGIPVRIDYPQIDADGDPVSFKLVSRDLTGYATILPLGSHSAGINARLLADPFPAKASYSLYDGKQYVYCTHVVKITDDKVPGTAANQVPVIASQTITIDEDTASVDGAVTMSDPDGDPVELRIIYLDNGPTHGIAMIRDAKAGTFTYYPNKNQFGADRIYISVTDGKASSLYKSVEVIINPKPDQPEPLPYHAVTHKNQPVNVDLIPKDVDDISGYGLNAKAYNYLITAAPAHGSVTITNGVLNYMPNTNYLGADTLKYKVSRTATFSGAEATVDINVEEFTEICSRADLEKIRDNNLGKYILKCDINMAGQDWLPPFTLSRSFGGIFDGGGHTLSNLRVRVASGGSFVGFMTDGIVRNLTFSTIDIYGTENAAGVAAQNEGLIRNVHITSGLVAATGPASAGGIAVVNRFSRPVGAGYLLRPTAKGIIACSNHATVTSDDGAGGIAAAGSAWILRSEASGRVEGGLYTGGIYGSLGSSDQYADKYTDYQTLQGIIADSSFTGVVTGRGDRSHRIGGIVGSVFGGVGFGHQTYPMVIRSFAEASVHGGSVVGGAVGGITKAAWFADSAARGTVNGIPATNYANEDLGGFAGHAGKEFIIERCSSSSTVDGATGYNVGGFIGQMGVGGGAATLSRLSDNYARQAFVRGKTGVGGFIGRVQFPIDTSRFPAPTIQNNYAANVITAASSVGGFIGVASAFTTFVRTASNYWDVTLTPQPSIVATGKTSAEMKLKNTYVGWDFDIWEFSTNAYPSLRAK